MSFLNKLTLTASSLLVGVATTEAAAFIAGDADLDHDVDSLDLVKISQAGKFETGAPANFEEGDFNGDAMYNVADLVAMFQFGRYETGPYDTPLPGTNPVVPAPLSSSGAFGDISFSYDIGSGLLSLNNPMNILMTSLHIESQAGLFGGARPVELSGLFDDFESDRYFRFDPSGFPSTSNVQLPVGLDPNVVYSDLRVAGSLRGGGALVGGSDPVPDGGSTALLGAIAFGSVAGLRRWLRRGMN